MEQRTSRSLDLILDGALGRYHETFTDRMPEEQDAVSDALMDFFRLTPEIKNRERQFYGRHLGAAWEEIAGKILHAHDPSTEFPRPGTEDTPCDIVYRGFAIDTKYRIGSGDSGTMRKLAGNASTLARRGFVPLLLIFRNDSLKPSISAARTGGWTICEGEAAVSFIRTHTGYDLLDFLKERSPDGLA
jgi:hypothetical protein